MDPCSFLLRHMQDPKCSIKVKMHQEDDGGVDWEGLPRSIEMELSRFDQETVAYYPATVLNVILGQVRQPRQPLRDSAEVSA